MSRTKNARTRVLGLVLTLSAAGCGLDLGPQSALEELERNRRLWTDTRPDVYRYTVRRLCFCAPETTMAVRVTVDGGTVIERVYVDTGHLVPAAWADLFPTVDGLFDLARDGLEGGADWIEVEYEPLTGVPTRIDIDYLSDAVDDELVVDVVEAPTPLVS